MLSRVRLVFQKRPLLTNMTSFGTMYVGAEISQQLILLKLEPEKHKSVDWDVVKRFAIVGMVGIGPALFVWYRFLDSFLKGASRTIVAKKVLTDQLCSSSACVGIFFVGMSILEGKEDIFAELKSKFWSTYKLSCCYWLPVQTINFALMPPYTRVAFVGAASFVWVNVLCLLKRKQLPDTEGDVPGAPPLV